MPSIQLIRTNAANTDFNTLVTALDKELAITDGADHDFYHQFNGLDEINHVIVAYTDDQPIGCGAIKRYDHNCVEIKRIFVSIAHRRTGYAMRILIGLQSWAKDLGYKKCILETGKSQPAAIALYQKAKFEVIENYDQYKLMENSICFGCDL